MKCPIKNLECKCIEKECPFWRKKAIRCGLELAADELTNITMKLDDILYAMEEKS